MVIVHGDVMCHIELANYLDTTKFCTLILAQDHLIGGYEKSVKINKKAQICELAKYFTRPDKIYANGFFTGIHILSESAVGLLKTNKKRCLVSEVYPEWLEQNKIITGAVAKLFYDDLGTPVRLHRANMNILKNNCQARSINYLSDYKKIGIDNNIFVGPGINISSSAKIIGPVIIAKNACLEKNTVVGPNTVIGKDVLIDCGAKLQNSVVMSNTYIKKDESLDCAIALIGDRVFLKRF
jgi:NDP-sugar pyrophosphorylase family protein